MSNQLTDNAKALRLFFTEDVYLVQENAQPTLIEDDILPVEQLEFKYLGKNQKKVLILVNDDEHEVSTEQGRALLRNLVKAIDLTANDFALLNYANYKNVKYTALQDFFQCQLLLSFGVSAMDLDLPTQPLHQIIAHQGAQIVFTSHLHLLDLDAASKKVLWLSLQQR